MDLSPKLFAVVVLLLLFGSTEMQGPVRVALARDCESQSHKFVGLCVRDQNCATVCLTEGFTGGKCHGFPVFRQRCFCTKPC
ncbi:defensin Tk-AMP-D4-like [Phragmites australis]|uniref:defensin Tk-AMP-D4-like n=1 Tax=Phragmites australis TaxID=29695 RepID=UPI002D7A0B15|nr:defensin Tk-AMP-D4-like [Phragmites australis]